LIIGFGVNLLITGLVLYLLLTSGSFSLAATYKAGYADFNRVAWSPDGKTLAALSDRKKLYLLEPNGKLRGSA
jgi:hypothetical protein